MAKEVYSVIKGRILSGAYESGEFINEIALAEELNVSRTPIRETLARLEWEKLVTIIPRAGAMVAPAELNAVKEAYQVRLILEGDLGRRAALRVTQTQIEQLEAIKRKCEGLVNAGTQDDLNALSREYRAVLGAAASNKTLFEMSELLFNVTVRVWHTIPEKDAHAELASALIAEIGAIIEAFKAKDGDAAQKAMQDAIRYYTEKLRRLFRE
ncbi:putative HTH-type transcriptional regulator YdfH [Roseovarius albus]|uniref:Putative HTH-type transcriptional regulator YdfH n=1 Tax=Roseovarius albus TaxID=1247867 RepID=A0A1X7A9L1_9RHOB|nr:GntR family transcriptional regulator [Roseovarius albus]SLN73460.1 putative HTH-type transcriptional regulator YdfH [Roseovarius albus]